MMDEKKVREAIYCMKASIGETMCEECVNYYKCDPTKADDMMRTAIEALEKQLAKNPIEVNDAYTPKVGEFRMAKCPNCGKEVSDRFDVCLDCRQNLDWSEVEE